MRKLHVSLLIVSLLIPVTTFALGFGNPIPLTNTRYGTVPGEARLASNGTDVFLFWAAGNSVRVTKLVDGVKRVGRPVVTITEPSFSSFDVLWNGTNFVVMSTNQRSITGRLLDRNGDPLAGEFVVVNEARYPRMAFNGTTILLLYQQVVGSRIGSLPLTKSGGPAGAGATVRPGADSWAVASDGRGFAAITASWGEVQLTTFDANGAITATESLSAEDTMDAAITSDGTRYFAAWFERGGHGISTVIDSGHAGLRVPFATSPYWASGPPSAAWSGSDFVLAYRDVRRDAITQLLTHSVQAIHFDTQGAPTLTEPEQLANPRRYATALLAHQGRVLMAWNHEEDAVVAALPLDSKSDATYGAANQRLLAAARSNALTLVVWSEWMNGATSVYAGWQDAEGNWSERLLANRVATGAVAASDGTNFVVALANEDRTGTAYRIDRRGVVSSKATAIPFNPTGIAWNGQHYGIVGEQGSGGYLQFSSVAARLDTSGDLSAPITLRAMDSLVATRSPAIASNGQDFLAIWIKSNFCYDCPAESPSPGIEGARLHPDLSRIDVANLEIAPQDQVYSPPAMTWNGDRYVVAYDNFYSMNAAFVDVNGSVTRQLVDESDTLAHRPHIANMTDGNVAILWQSTERTIEQRSEHRIVSLSPNGGVSDEATFPNDDYSDALLIGNGYGLSFLSYVSWFDAPHHGATRVLVRNAAFAIAGPPIGAPSAPTATARLDGGRMLVEWNGSSAEGYRIEYRVADGSWNEIAAWYDGQTRSATLTMPDNTAFRVRAFNAFGMSAPSAATATIRLNPPKRRSVR